ncbi:methyltransferase domain-containing protein [Actinoplanes sp. NPDC023801]|uniref:class I SAM-dependent methyltransferase n=1 Tax=Actinoplanes sp. NPDC023801 TaxID=3154595 RepID=UPI0033FE122A
MPDPIFAHPRLAAVYDTFDGDRDDLEAYEEIVAELGAGSVLDVGCGTGCLALRLAGRGLRVTGVDPAEASLEVARGKPGAGRVRWCAEIPAGEVFDVAVMTGNVAQVFLTDDDWAAVLRAVHGVLRPGGLLVFETRRPEYRAWDEWAARTGPVVREVPGVGRVEQRFALTSVRLPLVSLRYTYTFADGEVLTSDSTLRFRDRIDLHAGLTAAGFRVVEVRQAPDRPAQERVLLCEKPR